jgi:glycosyltransferase involved in cell wall biosynthesis
MYKISKKKIAICHYRVGGTDGVSLEITKRKEILEHQGHTVHLIAGPRSSGATHTIKELEWDNGIIPIIKENGFIHFKRKDLSARELKTKMNKIAYKIQDKLNFIQLKEKYDIVLIHNIFSFGGHIAAAKAFTKWIKKFKIKCLATHHDFYWERKEYKLPRNGYLKNYMDKYMPPKSGYIKHIVINSLAQQELKKRFYINSDVMGDVFDFNQTPWVRDKFNQNFLESFAVNKNDLIILQATRVIPRKGIELAIDYAKELQKYLKKLHGHRLYNNKKITSKSKLVLIIAGYAEDEKREYLFKLKNKCFEAGVQARFISDHVQAKRKYSDGIKTYSLWDAYAYADIVTFPSLWEGWGNQFIEAIFARKPIVLYEYPVYKTDIKKEGYRIISLGNNGSGLSVNKEFLNYLPAENINEAVKQSIAWLKDKKTNDKLEKNFQIGKKYHDYSVLEKFLLGKIN